VNALLQESITFAIPVNVQRQFLSDVLTTAVEGGITYWLLMVHSIERTAELDVLRVVGPLFVGEDKPLQKDITLMTVRDGLLNILTGKAKVSEDILRDVMLGVINNDASYIDAGDADVIVQAGLFGEVVYS
jgi:hypothetical protein